MSYENLPYESDNWKPTHRKRRHRFKQAIRYCRKHGRAEDVASRCFREARAPGPAVHVFKKFWNTNLGPNPVYIDSKQTYRRECEKAGGVCPL